MISLETFKRWINTIIASEQFAQGFEDLATKYDLMDFINPYSFYNINLLNTSIKCIAEAMGDDQEWIEWWINDTMCGQDHPYVMKDGIAYKLSTAEDLYYWIIDRTDKLDIKIVNIDINDLCW